VTVVIISFAIIGVIFLLIASHPFVTYPLSLLALQRLLPRPKAIAARLAEESLTCAICVCAYNEEHVIERKINNLLALRMREPRLQILVYVDAATDRTPEIVQRYANTLDYVHVSSERRGKTHGMNLLATKVTASLLIFSDANVIMDMECVADFRRHFADPEIGCVCGNLVYTNAAASVTAGSGSAYWRFEEALKRLESRTGSMIGADGSVFAIRRELHRPPPDNAIDDLYISLMILCMGHRVVQATDAHAYEECVTSGSEEFRRKMRIACQAFNVHRLMWGRLRQLDGLTLYKYISHKLIRWFTIYLLGMALIAFEVSLIAAGFVRGALATTCALLLAFVLGTMLSIRWIARIADILRAFVGTGAGIFQSLRGEHYQTWAPAASVRSRTLGCILALAGIALMPKPAWSTPLGVYQGNGCTGLRQLDAFVGWFGRKPDMVLDFFASDSWESMVSDATWALGCWRKTQTTVVFSIPMLPKGPYTLAQGAAGAYDARFEQLAKAMVAYGYGSATVRIGWEFNGGWFAWAAKPDPASWKAYWQHIVKAMRSVPGAKFRFDWCPNQGENQIRPDSVYPGDDFVDIIGLDVYNQTWNKSATTPQQRWDDLLNQPFGLKWQRDFARSHNKPISFPEWGTGTRPDGHGGGDDGYFVQQMAAWIADSDVAYQSYWDYPASDYNAKLSDGHQPHAGAAYQKAFAADRHADSP
jgi:cellulose synthase/poly-beta-1,6-N-acetylglucosamine synthase-like glycosyltransferase